MSRAHDPRIETLLSEARGSLADGRHRAAEDAFGRVLLHDPAHDEARAGRERASAALAEERRRLDAALDDARRAAEEGDLPAARALAEEVLRGGGDRDAALGLLDRLDAAGVPGVVLSARDTGAIPAGRPAPARRAPRRRWRHALTAAWMLAFALLAAAVVSGWEMHVARLTGAPLPGAHQAPPVTHYPAPTPGERALAAARARIEHGDPQGALVALDGVRPEDPAWPLAVQIRAQADRALTQPRRRGEPSAEAPSTPALGGAGSQGLQSPRPPSATDVQEGRR